MGQTASCMYQHTLYTQYYTVQSHTDHHRLARTLEAGTYGVPFVSKLHFQNMLYNIYYISTTYSCDQRMCKLEGRARANLTITNIARSNICRLDLIDVVEI